MQANVDKWDNDWYLKVDFEGVKKCPCATPCCSVVPMKDVCQNCDLVLDFCQILSRVGTVGFALMCLNQYRQLNIMKRLGFK